MSTRDARPGGASRPASSVTGREPAPADEALLSACSRDEILRGRLRLWQPRRGYRFSVDALLVAHFAWQRLVGSLPRGVGAARAPRGGLRATDLGAGSGVVGLALAERCAHLAVDLVEIQDRLAALAATNVEAAGLADRVTVHHADLRHLGGVLPGDRYALVVSNPPFTPLAEGRQSPDVERATAMAEHRVTLAELVAAAGRLLGPRSALCVIYPAERLPELVTACGASGLRPTRLRSVHAAAAAPAGRVLLEACKASGSPLEWLAPLVLHAAPGTYTDEAAAILDGAWRAPGSR